MDQRVLRWCAVFVSVLTLGVGVGVWFLPKLHEQSVQARERYSMDGVMLTFVQPQQYVGKEETSESHQLTIALPKGTNGADLVVENDYANRCIYLSIPTDSLDYFADYRVTGSCDNIDGITYNRSENMGQIVFAMNQVYEPVVTFDQDNCYLDFLTPQEAFDYVVVVDAGHGGRAGGATRAGVDEKDINLAIVEQLKVLFDETQDATSIGVYYTRLDDSNPSLEARVGLANEVHADLFLSVHCNTASKGYYSKTSGTMAMYQEYENSDGADQERELVAKKSKSFAKSCTDSVTEVTGGKAMKNRSGNSLYIIKNSQVPVALVEVGFLSNKEELEKLSDEEYRGLLAEGLYQAVMTTLEEQ